jgi:anthranilate 1,2-dioxygenase large subunit
MKAFESGAPEDGLQPIRWPAEINKIPKEIFVRPDVFEDEIRRIFHGPEWFPVAHEGEIPNNGDFKTYTLARMPLLITRDNEGKVNVMFNSCSHRGTQVETATSGNKKQFECPYHRWVFDAKGHLIGCPAKPGDFPADFTYEKYPLARPRVAIVSGLIMVSFSADAPPIEDYLEGLRDHIAQVLGGDGRLRLLGYQKVVFKANWKTYRDNDSYHAPLLHAAFRMLNWHGGKGKPFVNDRGHRGTVSELSLPKSTTLLKDNSLLEYRGGEMSAGSMIMHFFPLVSAIKHLDAITVRFANPLSVNETEVHYAYFGHADDDEEMTRHRVRQASNLLGPCGLVSMEDAAVFHRLQIGSHSPGPAIFQKGVKDEMRMPTQFGQNDETNNLPGWEHYRKIMGYAKEQA